MNQLPSRVAVVGLVLAVFAMSGCASFGNRSDSGESPTEAATTNVGRRLGACSLEDLNADLVFGLGDGRDEYHYAIRVTSTSTGGCTVEGLPIVHLAAGPGEPVGPAGRPVGVDGIPSPSITIRRKLAARSELVISKVDSSEAESCGARPISGVLLQLQTGTGTTWVPFPEPVYEAIPTETCSNQQSMMSVRPFFPSE